MSEDQDIAANIPNYKDEIVSDKDETFNVKVDLIGQCPDDSELIDAYERAVKLAKDEILQKRPDLQELDEKDESDAQNESNFKSKNSSNKHKSKKLKGNNNKKWSRGKPCRAVFSGDNKEYEAVICVLNPEVDECVVKFVGYGNKETVAFSSLKPSAGPRAVVDQKARAATHAESTLTDLNESIFSPSSESTLNSKKFAPFDCSRSENGFPAGTAMPPLPPPAFLAGQPLDNTESLSAVLMAWYMAGYHTGRYEASVSMKNKPY